MPDNLGAHDAEQEARKHWSQKRLTASNNHSHDCKQQSLKPAMRVESEIEGNKQRTGGGKQTGDSEGEKTETAGVVSEQSKLRWVVCQSAELQPELAESQPEVERQQKAA